MRRPKTCRARILSRYARIQRRSLGSGAAHQQQREQASTDEEVRGRLGSQIERLHRSDANTVDALLGTDVGRESGTPCLVLETGERDTTGS